MGTVSLEILKNYIQSQGGAVSSQQIVRHFQPFLKDANNKAHNKELFKSYLSTLTDYRQEPGTNVRILELKKAYRDSPVPQSPTSKENKPRNEGTRPGFQDQLKPMREAQLSAAALKSSPQKDPIRSEVPRSPRDIDGERMRREQSRERIRRDQSRDQLMRDKSRDKIHREYSKDDQREFQRDPQRQLTRDQSREFQQDKVGGAAARTPTTPKQLTQERSPRSGTRRTAHERRSPAPQRSPTTTTAPQRSPTTTTTTTTTTATSPPSSAASPEEVDNVPPQNENAVVTPTQVKRPEIRKASINAINMFNRTAQQKKPPVAVNFPDQVAEEEEEDGNSVFVDKADTLDSNTHEDLREEMESGCSNVPLEQGEKEWIVKSALGDCNTISRLLLTDKNLVYYKDFISGYTGLHWACKLGRIDMAKILLEAGSEVNMKSNSGHTPLHLAAQTGKTDLIELIIRYGADKDIRDHKGKKSGHYLPPTAPEEIKGLLNVHDPRLVNHTNPALRKLSKHQSVGFDINDNTPKRAQTLNQAWKKYKHSFVTKKKKDGGKIDSNKRDSTLAPRHFRFSIKREPPYVLDVTRVVEKAMLVKYSVASLKRAVRTDLHLIRGDSKENHKYGKAQTLPPKQTAIYNF
ncbi:ankyrin repeat domain-containing protein SOWAHA-like isoform X4 [Bolinopsis microptera]|uniref:ankyrin repeat domain-containing protein SOWAHA-like isoform X4 n=1 Tax=Bolinopsis microptera TaxID=2820187 RepID=UPI003078D862